MGHNHRIDEYYNESYVHKPILWREILDIMEQYLKKGGVHIVDCTLGEGGHSEIFLKRYPDVLITAFERDEKILDVAKERLKVFADRVRFINDNFSKIEGYFDSDNLPDCILYDFGISSYHFELSGRGFAFANDEPLDMRLGGSVLSAYDVINDYSQEDLARIFKEYGEENWAAWIAKIIVERRSRKPIETTGELASIVLAAIPKKFHVKNIHPATRVFQAVRIEVNSELKSIEQGILGGFKILKNTGLMFCISFHSLEDRIVKNFFRRMKSGCLCGNEPSHCNCNNESFAEIITKKPLMAQDDEINWNNRSRSAKLRALRKLQGF